MTLTAFLISLTLAAQQGKLGPTSTGTVTISIRVGTAAKVTVVGSQVSVKSNNPAVQFKTSEVVINGNRTVVVEPI